MTLGCGWQIMDKEAYAQLRTIEQLGYIVAVVSCPPPALSTKLCLPTGVHSCRGEHRLFAPPTISAKLWLLAGSVDLVPDRTRPSDRTERLSTVGMVQ